MSVESGIATESRSGSLATDGVGLSTGSIRSTADMTSNFEATSRLWSADGNVDGTSRRQWGEFNIWGNSGSSEMGNNIWNAGSLSTMFQNIAGEGLTAINKAEANNGDFAWHNAPVMSESNGNSESLGLSDLRQEPKTWYGGFGFGSNSVESNSFGSLGSNGGDGWGMPSSSSIAEPKAASVDWSINKDNTLKPNQSGGWPGNTGENEKTDQLQRTWSCSDVSGAAAAHVRSSSAACDSTAAGKETESGKLVSASLSGNMDVGSSSTPQPSEPTAEELLIAKMIESHEGWGTRPVRQDTPWMIETSSPNVAAVIGSVVDNVAVSVKADVGSVWNSPKEAPGAGPYWGVGPSSVNSTDWNNDSDIGVWIGPPSADAVNPNMWTGHGNASAGWPGVGPSPASRVNTSDLATALAGNWSDTVGLPAAIANKLAMNAAANSSLDKSRPTDAQWIAALTKPQPSGGWASDPVSGSWSMADAQDPAGALIRAQLQLAAQPPRPGHQFEVRPPTTGLKIDTWNEPPVVPDTLLHPGHWGQPPANAVCRPDSTVLIIIVALVILPARPYASSILAVIACPCVCHKSVYY